MREASYTQIRAEFQPLHLYLYLIPHHAAFTATRKAVPLIQKEAWPKEESGVEMVIPRPKTSCYKQAGKDMVKKGAVAQHFCGISTKICDQHLITILEKCASV